MAGIVDSEDRLPQSKEEAGAADKGKQAKNTQILLAMSVWNTVQSKGGALRILT